MGILIFVGDQGGQKRTCIIFITIYFKTEGETIKHRCRPEWIPESDHRLPTSAKPSLPDTPMWPHPPDADPTCARRSR